jgi:hypothetical protein
LALDGTEWGIAEAGALVAAIDLELEQIRATDQALVAKGRLNQREADWRSGVVADIRADLLHAFAPLADNEIREPNDSRVAWHDKVRWISRELEARRELYPNLVAKGRITEADAARRIGAIAALHRLYWERMFQWLPPEGPALEYLRALRSSANAGVKGRQLLSRSEGRRIYQDFVRAHMAELALERGKQGRLVA